MSGKLKSVLEFIQDRRNQALLVFFVIAVVITSATINQISFNYKLDQEARLLEEQNALIEQQLAIKNIENEFFSTAYYKELRARDELGLVSEGESILVLATDDYKQLRDTINENYWQDEPAEVDESEKSNIEKWILFFSGKDPV